MSEFLIDHYSSNWCCKLSIDQIPCKIITRVNKGKTDVAMLTILRVLDQHRSIIAPGSPLRVSINRDSFKIIYVSVQMIDSP